MGLLVSFAAPLAATLCRMRASGTRASCALGSGDASSPETGIMKEEPNDASGEVVQRLGIQLQGWKRQGVAEASKDPRSTVVTGTGSLNKIKPNKTRLGEKSS